MENKNLQLEIKIKHFDHDISIGYLIEKNKKIFFEYNNDFIDKKIDLSPYALPNRKEIFTEFPYYQEFLPGLFYDSLPDGFGMLLMHKYLKKRNMNIQEVSPLYKLSLIGKNGSGALEYIPGENFLIEKSVDLVSIYEQYISVLNDKNVNDIKNLFFIGGSLNGARPKSFLYYNEKEKKFSYEKKEGFSQWIFKFPSQNESTDVCFIEDAYNKTAMKCGIKVTDSVSFALNNNKSVFGTKRFDRINENNIEKKIHIASLASILELNFRNIGVLGYEDFFRTVFFLTRSKNEVIKAFDRCLFNFIYHNRDDHAKNFSFIMDKNFNWQLSPAYDLTFSYGPGGEHSLDMNGKGKNIHLNDFYILAKKFDIQQNYVNEKIEIYLQNIKYLKSLLDDYPMVQKTKKELIKNLTTNANSLSNKANILIKPK